MASPRNFPPHSRTESAFSQTSNADSLAAPANPFKTPPASYPGSVIDFGSSYQPSDVSGEIFSRSRRIRKDWNASPPKFKKEPKEKWLTIIPLSGIGIGTVITGLLIFLQVGLKKSYNYCSVLDDDFSTGILNPSIWTKEVNVGGFGNQQFEETTGTDENAFIKDGQLYIKPTLQDESLITANSIIDLTNSGCTGTSWSDCVAVTNITNGTIIPPVKSARLNTKLGATIKYGRVEVKAKIPKGDWLWPAIWMMPVTDTYGAWPASGEIDIMESRGNNYSYSLGGNNIVSSALHWGPNPDDDAYRYTQNNKHALHSEFGDDFHIYGLEWSEKYLFTFVDTRLLQVFYNTFSKPLWPQGDFPFATVNGTRLLDPWSQTGRLNTPFDQDFYLIINVAVGGQNGWFLDGADGKPWVDSSPTAKQEFWNARDQWYPTWNNNGQMIINRVQMFQQC